MVNKSTLISKIADLLKKRINGISDIGRINKEGIRIVIELKGRSSK